MMPRYRPSLRAAVVLAAAGIALVLSEGAARSQESAPQSQPARGREVFGRIRGTVYGAGKKPLAGQMVLLSSRDQSGLLRVTGTDLQGQYLFQDLAAGSYDIEAGAEGYAPQSKTAVEVRPPFQNLIDFHLEPAAAGASGAPPAPRAASLDGVAGVPVRGVLHDQQRRPVSEVSVAFVSLEGKGIYQTFSGGKGDFAFQTLPSGRYRVRVASPGHVTLDLKSVEVAPPGGLTLSLTLVDYPLNFKGRPDRLLPREMPQRDPVAAPAATPAATPAASSAPAPAATP